MRFGGMITCRGFQVELSGLTNSKMHNCYRYTRWLWFILANHTNHRAREIFV